VQVAARAVPPPSDKAVKKATVAQKPGNFVLISIPPPLAELRSVSKAILICICDAPRNPQRSDVGAQ
jgi:hypothetical protein